MLWIMFICVTCTYSIVMLFLKAVIQINVLVLIYIQIEMHKTFPRNLKINNTNE